MWSVDTVQTYVINLDRRRDRWEALEAQPEVRKIPNVQRFSAVDGKTLNAETDSRISVIGRYNIKNFTRRSHDMLDSIGGVGCALSHITLWQKLAASDQEVFLILEDDLIVRDGMWGRVRTAFAKYPWLADTSKWDLWSLGNIACNSAIGTFNGGDDLSNHKYEDTWVQCKEFLGLNGYFLTKAGAKKLLSEVFPLQQHIDWYITYYAQNRPFKIIFNKNIFFAQRGTGSDIAMKKVCAICDVPTDVEKSHFMVKKEHVNLAVLAGISVALVAWLAYSGKIKMKK